MVEAASGRAARRICDAVRAADDTDPVCGIRGALGPRPTSRCTLPWPRRLSRCDVRRDGGLQPARRRGGQRPRGASGRRGLRGGNHWSDKRRHWRSSPSARAGRNVPVLRPQLHHGRCAHDGVRARRPPRTSRRPRSSSTTTATRRTLLRAPRCARRSSSPKRVAGTSPARHLARETEIEGAEGARGALVDGIPVHSVRSMGFVASQEVVFGIASARR